MIHDSTVWKNDLENELNNIIYFFKNTDLNYDQEFEENNDDDVEERDMEDVAFIKLQKFAIYSSIIIRKLIEANKISDELLSRNFPVKIFKRQNLEKVTLWNGYEIEKLYDIQNPERSSISIKDLTHSIIHSFHFIPYYNYQKFEEDLPDDDIESWEIINIAGIYFSSDKTKNTHLSYIDFKKYLYMITCVLNDFIIFIKYKEGDIIKKSTKPPVK